MTIDIDRLDQQVRECLDLAQGAPDPVAQAVRDALTVTCSVSWFRNPTSGVLFTLKYMQTAPTAWRADDHPEFCHCHGTGRVPRVWHPDPTEDAEEAAWCGRLYGVLHSNHEHMMPLGYSAVVLAQAYYRIDLHAALDALADCQRALQGAQP